MKDESITAIKALPYKTCYDVDKASSNMQKHFAGKICASLSVLFNNSLKQGIFPNTWKQALFTPVFKKDDKYEMKNYRYIIAPLGLALTCSEKRVCRQLTDTLYKRWSNTEYGYLCNFYTINSSRAFDFIHFNHMAIALHE